MARSYAVQQSTHGIFNGSRERKGRKGDREGGRDGSLGTRVVRGREREAKGKPLVEVVVHSLVPTECVVLGSGPPKSSSSNDTL